MYPGTHLMIVHAYNISIICISCISHLINGLQVISKILRERQNCKLLGISSIPEEQNKTKYMYMCICTHTMCISVFLISLYGAPIHVLSLHFRLNVYLV